WARYQPWHEHIPAPAESSSRADLVCPVVADWGSHFICGGGEPGFRPLSCCASGSPRPRAGVTLPVISYSGLAATSFAAAADVYTRPWFWPEPHRVHLSQSPE